MVVSIFFPIVPISTCIYIYMYIYIYIYTYTYRSKIPSFGGNSLVLGGAGVAMLEHKENEARPQRV